MANVKDTKKKAADKKTSVKIEKEVIDTIVTEKPKTARKLRNQLSKDTDVLVRNGFAGRLIYVSKKTGYEVIFDNFGSEQYLTIDELRTAKNSSPSFFSNNWFIIDDEEVIYDLSLERFYANSLNIDELDGIFDLPLNEMIDTINGLPEGQKSSLVFKALEKIETGVIDSRKTIEALEDVLNTELVEK